MSYGHQSLKSNVSGTYNTASGFRSMYSNTTGDQNVANGIIVCIQIPRVHIILPLVLTHYIKYNKFGKHSEWLFLT